MTNTIRLTESKVNLPTRMFPYGTFSFENFNPIQSALLPVYETSSNVVVAAATSGGKTACAEMFLAHTIRVEKKKGIYVSPLKALAQEKVTRWSDPSHHFSDLNISICTGDYLLTEKRKEELRRADLIIMTSEMVHSRLRNAKSEKNDWLTGVGVLVADESHLLVVPGRGDRLEVALMKLTELNPDVRIVGLSATLPNVSELCDWICHLTNRSTYLLCSNYRPCPLQIHYEPYDQIKGSYDENEASKLAAAERIIGRFPEDKFIVFVHSKRTGEMALKAFQDRGWIAGFHNADLTKEKRIELEARFRAPGGLKVLVATSTLAWGVDMPARRVIVLGIHRGMSLVPAYDISQEVGRAGRPSYDPAGDAYVLLADDKKTFAAQKAHCETPTLIESQLLTWVGTDANRSYKVLAFHVVSEIHHRQIRTRDDLRQWYKRTLAHHQAHVLDTEIVDNVVDLLVNCGAIREEDGQFEATAVGTVASMLYYSPFDVADYRKNFENLFAHHRDHDDRAVAMALGDIDSDRFGICSRAERDEINAFARSLVPVFGTKAFTEAAVKAGYCYYMLLKGRHSRILQGVMRGYEFDFDRTLQVLRMVDQMASRWQRRGWFEDLKVRVRHGVEPHLVALCGLPEVKAVRAQKLYESGIRSIAEVAGNPDKVAKVLGFKGRRLDDVIQTAKRLVVEAMVV